jgi:hypothetical protein
VRRRLAGIRRLMACVFGRRGVVERAYDYAGFPGGLLVGAASVRPDWPLLVCMSLVLAASLCFGVWDVREERG